DLLRQKLRFAAQSAADPPSGCLAGSIGMRARRIRDPRGTAWDRSPRTHRLGEGCCSGESHRAPATAPPDRARRADRERAEQARFPLDPRCRATAEPQALPGGTEIPHDATAETQA